jgi:putative IMPACT (imprinted ancient) family translation regulator
MVRNTAKILKIDFGDSNEPSSLFQHFEKIIHDRGSIYSVSIGWVHNREDIKRFLHQTKKIKHHNTATHHIWAVRISNDGVVYESKRDNGEIGGGDIILRILQKKNMTNTIVCVTRWYGGIKLERDRFKHIQDAVIYGIENT